LFLEQFRLELVPVLLGLQGRLAAGLPMARCPLPAAWQCANVICEGAITEGESTHARLIVSERRMTLAISIAAAGVRAILWPEIANFPRSGAPSNPGETPGEYGGLTQAQDQVSLAANGSPLGECRFKPSS